MDWLTFLTSIGATVATVIGGWFAFRHQMRQEHTRQIELDAAGRQQDRAHVALMEQELWQRTQAEFSRLHAAIDDERQARQKLQAELDAERQARQELAERVRHLEAENARLLRENEELRAGVKARKL